MLKAWCAGGAPSRRGMLWHLCLVIAVLVGISTQDSVFAESSLLNTTSASTESALSSTTRASTDPQHAAAETKSSQPSTSSPAVLNSSAQVEPSRSHEGTTLSETVSEEDKPPTVPSTNISEHAADPNVTLSPTSNHNVSAVQESANEKLSISTDTGQKVMQTDTPKIQTTAAPVSSEEVSATTVTTVDDSHHQNVTQVTSTSHTVVTNLTDAKDESSVSQNTSAVQKEETTRYPGNTVNKSDTADSTQSPSSTSVDKSVKNILSENSTSEEIKTTTSSSDSNETVKITPPEPSTDTPTTTLEQIRKKDPGSSASSSTAISVDADGTVFSASSGPVTDGESNNTTGAGVKTTVSIVFNIVEKNSTSVNSSENEKPEVSATGKPSSTETVPASQNNHSSSLLTSYIKDDKKVSISNQAKSNSTEVIQSDDPSHASVNDTREPKSAEVNKDVTSAVQTPTEKAQDKITSTSSSPVQVTSDGSPSSTPSKPNVTLSSPLSQEITSSQLVIAPTSQPATPNTTTSALSNHQPEATKVPSDLTTSTLVTSSASSHPAENVSSEADSNSTANPLDLKTTTEQPSINATEGTTIKIVVTPAVPHVKFPGRARPPTRQPPTRRSTTPPPPPRPFKRTRRPTTTTTSTTPAPGASGPPIKINFARNRTRAKIPSIHDKPGNLSALTPDTEDKPTSSENVDFDVASIGFPSEMPPIEDYFFPEYQDTACPFLTEEEITVTPSLKIAGVLKIVKGVGWKRELAHKNAPKFRSLSCKVKLALEEMFGKTSIGKSLIRVEIDAFSNGSVIVDYYLYLRMEEESVNPEALKEMFLAAVGKNNTLGSTGFTIDPVATTFEEPVKISKSSVVANTEPPIPQWAIAVIVIATASLIFIVLFGAVTVYGRNAERRKYSSRLHDEEFEKVTTPTKDCWESKFAASYENYAADGIYDMEQSCDSVKNPDAFRKIVTETDSWKTEYGGFSNKRLRRSIDTSF